MGIWDRIKGLFGAGPPKPVTPDADAGDGGADDDGDERAQKLAGLRAMAPTTAFSNPGRNTPPAAAAAAATAAAPAEPPAPNPYENSKILGLSADELRKRALRINPFRTPWIGRVDTIPPQSDERTAIIDRGLILRGFLTPAQIREIHEVGDLWLKYHDIERVAGAAALKTKDEIVAQLAREKAARKAEKKRLAAERHTRRTEDVARRRREDIIFLGRGVSRLLGDRRCHVEKLMSRSLPVLASPADVARALGLSVAQLRWLSFHNEAAERTHYVTFQIPKRSGGLRTISAPHHTLAKAQRWILENILSKLEVEAPAHGFVAQRSTVTNATPHLGQDLVVNLDLRDFFPTITFPRVRGMFARLGYSPAAATVLALISTESPRLPAEYDGQSYAVAVGPRALPQGAPTSPAISNQVSRRLDRRLAGVATKYGWTYTRYADDLSFSAPAGKRGELPMMLARIRAIISAEGFTINPKKGRIQRRARRQEVTGVVVNDKPGLPREEVRRLRAILHQAKKTGLEAQNRENKPDFEAWVRGRIAYLSMVDRAKGQALLAQLDALVARAPSA